MDFKKVVTLNRILRLSIVLISILGKFAIANNTSYCVDWKAQTDSLCRFGKYSVALEIFRKQGMGCCPKISQSTDNLNEWINKAESHLENQQVDSAEIIIKGLNMISFDDARLKLKYKYLLGRYYLEIDSTKIALNTLLDLEKEIGDSDYELLAKTVLRQGSCYRALYNGPVAIREHKRAIEILKKAPTYDELCQFYDLCLASAHLINNDNITALYIIQNQISNSDTCSKEALQLQTFIYYSIALKLYMEGDFHKSLKYFLLVLDNLKYYPIENMLTDKNMTITIGYVYEYIHDYDRAIEFFKKYEDEIQFKIHLGICYFRKENYDLAEKYLNILFTEGEQKQILSDKIDGWLVYSKLQLTKQNYEKARYAAQEAINLSINKYKRQYRIIRSYCSYAEYLINVNEIDSASIYLDMVCNLDMKKGNWDRQYIDTPYFINQIRAKAYSLYGDLYYECAKNTKDNEVLITNYRNALRSYEKSIELYENNREGYSTEETKLIISSEINDVYRKYVEMAIILLDITNDESFLTAALQYSERQKQNTLISSMKKKNAIMNLPLTDSIKDRIVSIRNSVEKYKTIISEKESFKMNNKLITFETEYNILMNKLETKYPQLKNSKNLSLVNLKEIQTRLELDQVILDYQILDSSLVIFFIDSQKINIHVDNQRNNIDTLVSCVHRFLSKQCSEVATKNDREIYLNSTFELYSILVKPFEEKIKGKSLIIVPCDMLCYLPFEILLTSNDKKDGFGYLSLPYLINSNPISYAYALNLINTNESKTKDSYNVLAIAPGFEKGNGENLKFLNENIYRGSLDLGSLPYSLKETSDILEYFDGICLKGEKATKYYLNKHVSNYDILHFATHTIIDDNSPMYSKIVLSTSDSDDDNSYLNTYEIYDLNIPADLVVLSGCQTGYGKLYGGEGISGLSNGFIHAGCKSLVATLWKQEDEAAYELVVSFYKYLKEGNNKDVALQKAKIEYLSNCDPAKANPHFWAGFVLIGNNSALVSGSKSVYALLIAFLLILIAGFVVKLLKE